MAGVRNYAIAFVGLLTIGLIAWVCWSFTQAKIRSSSTADGVESASGIVTFPNGDLRAEVAGAFSGPPLRVARESYRKNLEVYSQFRMRAINEHAASTFKQLIETHAPNLKRQSPVGYQRLLEHWGILVELLGNHDVEQYIRSLHPARRANPLTPAELDDPYISARYERAIKRAGSNSFDVAAANEFIRGTEWPVGARVNALADDERGWAAACRRVTSLGSRVDLLSDVLPIERREWMIGKLTQSCYLVSSSPLSSTEQMERDGSILFAEVAFVVRTTDKDAYPIHFLSSYDPATQTWWLVRASRQSSIRAANYYSMVF